MGKFTFDDDEYQEEPSFSLHEFKKWLSKQGKPDPDIKNEAEVEKIDPVQEKEQFKEKMRKRRKKD